MVNSGNMIDTHPCAHISQYAPHSKKKYISEIGTYISMAMHLLN